MEASAKVYTILLSGTAGAELPLELLLYKVIVAVVSPSSPSAPSEPSICEEAPQSHI